MDKKLPKMFKNKIEKIINNNEKVYYSRLEERNIKKENKISKKSGLSAMEKINKFINTNSYIVNLDAVITYKQETFSTKIVGRMNNIIITSDKKVIPINEIEDIEFN